MTDCGGCGLAVALRRRITDLEAEIVAWSRWAEDWRHESDQFSRADAAARRFGLSAGQAALLFVLIDQPGRVLSTDRLFHVVGGSRGGEDTKLVAVYVTKIRAALKRDGLGGVETVWGRGYRISPPAAAAIEAALDGPPQPSPPLSAYERRVLKRMTPGSATAVLGRPADWISEQRQALGLP